MVSGFLGAGLGQDIDWLLTKSSVFKPICKSRQTISFDVLCSNDLLNPEPFEGFHMPPSYLEVSRHVLTLGLVIPIDLVDDQL